MRTLVPAGLKTTARRVGSRLRDAGRHLVPVREHSSAINIYHCCVHKTASQWLRKIFDDVETWRYSGLHAYHYQTEMRGGFDGRRLSERSFDESFPEGTIVSPLYLDHPNYARIPKPDDHRTFFVSRDPRDVLVSWYFSTRYSHGKMGNVSEMRGSLERCSEREGLCLMIEHLERFGLFGSLASWIAAARDGNVHLVRFEELTGAAKLPIFAGLFRHLDIRMPEGVLAGVLDRYSFARLAGRTQGEEDQRSHYRKGTPGDWENHFDDQVARRFEQAAGDLVGELGYA